MSEHAWVHEHLDAYLTGDLNADEIAQVDRHLASCGACQEELGEARQVTTAMDRLFASARPAPDLEERAVATVRSASLAASSRPSSPIHARRSAVLTRPSLLRVFRKRKRLAGFPAKRSVRLSLPWILILTPPSRSKRANASRSCSTIESEPTRSLPTSSLRSSKRRRNSS
jgi:anti-sigma factor RsiW